MKNRCWRLSGAMIQFANCQRFHFHPFASPVLQNGDLQLAKQPTHTHILQKNQKIIQFFIG
jgi:hypothetical protein